MRYHPIRLAVFIAFMLGFSAWARPSYGAPEDSYAYAYENSNPLTQGTISFSRGFAVPILSGGHYSDLGNHDSADLSFLTGATGDSYVCCTLPVPPGVPFLHESRGYLIVDLSNAIQHVANGGSLGAMKIRLNPSELSFGGIHQVLFVGFTLLTSPIVNELQMNQVGRTDLFDALGVQSPTPARPQNVQWAEMDLGQWIGKDLKDYMAQSNADPIVAIGFTPLPVPEPSTLGLLVLGGLLLATVRLAARLRASRP